MSVIQRFDSVFLRPEVDSSAWSHHKGVSVLHRYSRSASLMNRSLWRMFHSPIRANVKVSPIRSNVKCSAIRGNVRRLNSWAPPTLTHRQKGRGQIHWANSSVRIVNIRQKTGRALCPYPFKLNPFNVQWGMSVFRFIQVERPVKDFEKRKKNIKENFNLMT